MIEIHSLVAVFAAEVLIGLLLLVAGFGIYSARRKSDRRSVADDLIEKFNAERTNENEQLKKVLLETCGLDHSAFEEFQHAATDKEKQLYSHIVTMFLEHDPALLASIDEPIQALTEPYCELVVEISKTRNETTAPSAGSDEEISRLNAECQRLAVQLGMALETVDGVCSEYSQLFGQAKSATELQASCERMLNVFRQATQIVTGTQLKNENEIEQEAHVEEI